jgi:hypothetical protein
MENDMPTQARERTREQLASLKVQGVTYHLPAGLGFPQIDIIAFVIILAFGLASFLYCERSADFLGEDVFYADCAQSLLHHGYYGINGHPETNQPPGLTLILAPLLVIFGNSHIIFQRAMAVLETLGFLLTYEVLRRRGSRLLAASICILLITSPIYFMWATRLIFPCYPFLASSMAALLAGEESEKAQTRFSRLAWSLGLALAVAASLMIASAAIAFLGAIVAVVALTAFQDRRLAWSRLRVFLPALLIGIVVQGLWMHRRPAPLEWPLPGYPGPYLQQLMVKAGEHPELGMATLRDVAARFGNNALAHSDMLAQLVLRHGVSLSKLAVVIAPILFIALGLGYSLWETGGRRIMEWYFAGYEFIYLLWPWKLEARFFIPVAPLACFYLWQGLKAAYLLVRTRPRLTGAVWCPIGILLSMSGAHWVASHWATGLGDLPDELLIPVYAISAVIAARMAYSGWVPSQLASINESPEEHGQRNVVMTRYALWGTIALLVCIGAAKQVAMARENLSIANMPVNQAAKQLDERTLGEIEAASWIRNHTAPDSVVMARHLPIMYHYSDRKLVWFAPTSNPQMLLQGIVKHQVDYVVVIRHSPPYYLPDDDSCWAPLMAAHGDLFQVVLQEPGLKIFRVAKKEARAIL